MSRDVWIICLIGLGAGAFLALASLIPFVGCLALPCTLLLYAVFGAVAALRLPQPREAGRGAGTGALAGLSVGLGYTVMNTILTPLVMTMMGGPQGLSSALPPQILEMYRQAGIDPAMILSPGMLIVGTILCGISNLVFAAIIGAIAGLIAAAASR